MLLWEISIVNYQGCCEEKAVQIKAALNVTNIFKLDRRRKYHQKN